MNVVKINVSGGLFHNYRASGFGENKAETSSLLAGGAKKDRLTLSGQVLAVIQMHNRIREIEQAKENARNSPEAKMLDNMKKAMSVLKTCTRIAARIQAGDKVPLKDLRYLMQHDPQAYHMAMASRKPKENPKECESAVPKGEQDERPAKGDAAGPADGIPVTSDAEGASDI